MGITGIVLAGGKSSRFGKDKALAGFSGKTLVEHSIAILQGVCGEILISSNNPEQFHFTGLPVIMDIYPQCGPIGGIHSGLIHASYEKVLFLGCDMPLISKDLLLFMIQSSKTHQGVIPMNEGFKQSLCILLEKNSSGVIEDSLKNKVYKILDALEGLKINFLETSKESFFYENLFFNVNTETDLKILENIK
jgi:molybdenum cofactor guanylyltransferase